jgi:hypothetical protein
MKIASGVIVAQLLLGVVCAAGSGCLALADGTSGGCLDDDDCDRGEVCAFGLCVDANDGRLDAVDVEVEPLASSGLPTQSLFDVDAAASAGARFDLTLRPAVAVNGTGRLVDGGPLTGVVSATPRRAIPGRLRLPSASVVDGSWTLALVDDTSWRLAAVADDPAIAPAVADADIVAGVDNGVALVACRLVGEPAGADGADGADGEGTADDAPGDPAACPVRVRGRVVAGLGAAALGVPLLEVRVVDDRGRRISTVARTDDDGRFVVGLPSAVAATGLQVRPTADNALQPVLDLPLVFGDDLDLDLGEISQGPRADTVTVAGVVVDDAGGPARGATVVMRGLVGAGLYVTRAITDDDGAFRVAVRPGPFAIAAVGATDGEAGLFVGEVDVDAAVDDLRLVLPPRVTATLAVRLADGTALSAASVVLQRVGDRDGVGEPALADAQPVFLAATDDDGLAELRVDDGRYRIAIQPPQDVGAPAFSALVVVDGDSEVALTLPRGLVLAGTAADATGLATSGAVVRVFSQLTDEAGRAIFLGEAVTAPDGSFSVAVPDLRR